MSEENDDPKFHTKFAEPYGSHPNGKELPWRDFNRELIPPGTDKDFPDGAVLINMDDDFWVAAILPWEPYHNLTAGEIVEELWPEIHANSTFKPDHGDPYWEAYWKENPVVFAPVPFPFGED